MLFATLLRRSCPGTRSTGRSHRPMSRRLPSAPRPGFVPRLEVLEDRTLLSVGLLFDAPSGTVALRGDAGDHTVRQTLDAAGFVDVAIDGSLHSGDPASVSFDPALAGARASTVTGLRFTSS